MNRIIVASEEKESHLKQLKGALIRQRQKDGWKVKDGLDVEKLLKIQSEDWSLPKENIIKYLEELEAKGFLIWDKEFNIIFGSKKLEDEMLQRSLEWWGKALT